MSKLNSYHQALTDFLRKVLPITYNALIRDIEQEFEQLDKWRNGELPKGKPKMTREEAARIIHSKVYGITNTGQAAKWVDALEALGLIKFKEPNIKKLCSAEGGNDNYNIRVEEWRSDNGELEGYVLWFNGKIVWKSWKQ